MSAKRLRARTSRLSAPIGRGATRRSRARSPRWGVTACPCTCSIDPAASRCSFRKCCRRRWSSTRWKRCNSRSLRWWQQRARRLLLSRFFTEHPLHLAAKRNCRIVLVVGDVLPTNATIGSDCPLELHPVRKPKRHDVLAAGCTGGLQRSVHRVPTFSVERLAGDEISLCGGGDVRDPLDRLSGGLAAESNGCNRYSELEANRVIRLVHCRIASGGIG